MTWALFFLSVDIWAARELTAALAHPCAKGHSRAFAFPSRDALFAGVSAAYRRSMSLPTLPYEDFLRETAHLGETKPSGPRKFGFRGPRIDFGMPR